MANFGPWLSKEPPDELLVQCLDKMTATSSHTRPWTFCIIKSTKPQVRGDHVILMSLESDLPEACKLQAHIDIELETKPCQLDANASWTSKYHWVALCSVSRGSCIMHAGLYWQALARAGTQIKPPHSSMFGLVQEGQKPCLCLLKVSTCFAHFCPIAILFIIQACCVIICQMPNREGDGNSHWHHGSQASAFIPETVMNWVLHFTGSTNQREASAKTSENLYLHEAWATQQLHTGHQPEGKSEQDMKSCHYTILLCDFVLILSLDTGRLSVWGLAHLMLWHYLEIPGVEGRKKEL